MPGVACLQCSEYAVCAGNGTVPYARPGHWYNADHSKPDSAEYRFEQCISYPDRCDGKLYASNGGCKMGTTGIQCSQCAVDWFLSNNECQQCTNDIKTRFLVVVVVIIVLVIVFYKFAQLKMTYLSSISIAVSYFQLIAVFALSDFHWPDSLKSALSSLQFINLNLNIIVPECAITITYTLKWALTLSLPFIFGALLMFAFSFELLRSVVVTWTGPLIKPWVPNWYVVDKRNFFTKFCTECRRDFIEMLTVPKTGPEIQEFADQCLHTFIVIISFCYVFVISKAAEIYDCVQVEDGSFLFVLDTTLNCFQRDWWWYFPFSLILMIAFGIGVFGLFLYLTLNRHKIATDKQFNNRFRFLFVRFRNEALYWEAVIIVRKLLISASVYILSRFQMLVILFGILVIFVSFILQVHHVPYRRVFHNMMEYIQLLTTEFLLFAGLLFFVGKFPNQLNWRSFDYANALGYLTIVVVVISTVLLVMLIILDIVSQVRRDWKRSRLNKKNKNVSSSTSSNSESNDDVTLMSPVEMTNVDLPPQVVVDSAVVEMVPAGTAQSVLRRALLRVKCKILNIPNVIVGYYKAFLAFLDKIEGEDSEEDWELRRKQIIQDKLDKEHEELMRIEREKELEIMIKDDEERGKLEMLKQQENMSTSLLDDHDDIVEKQASPAPSVQPVEEEFVSISKGDDLF
ncbi:10 TM domain-containing transmembrane protein [Acrasis kona]|uniref:10 TM domain-containing transmembrane protein n=1 Tax=Acrasis kona TaxID=1008807 RepID=A0AAW2Z8M6_9EUKA